MPQGGTPPRQLVVLLHGFGSDGNDLIALGQHWRQLLPDAAFVSPHAPERCLAGGRGYQWFSLTFRDMDERWNGVVGARRSLDAFLDAELKRHELTESQLALVGFSQGTMMALHTGLRRTIPPAAILGYSGVLAGPEHLQAEVRTTPPILLVHGEADDVIPANALFGSAEALAKAGIPCAWHLSPGMPHTIDQDGLRLGGAFLEQAFSGKLGRPR